MSLGVERQAPIDGKKAFFAKQHQLIIKDQGNLVFLTVAGPVTGDREPTTLEVAIKLLS
jgi:hypothetical protein